VDVVTGGFQVLWEKEYNNGRNRDIVQVIETSDNSFLELIKTLGNSMAWTEVVKIDSAGNIQWDYEYNQNEWKEPNYIMKLPDGYLFVTTNWTLSGRGVFVTKIDLNGSKIWEKSFNRKTNQEFIRIALLTNDTLILTTKAFESIDNGIRINCSINDFILNLNGDLISENSVSNNNKFNEGSYAFLALIVPGDGFLTSNSYSPINSGLVQYDIIVQKFNELNQLSWENIYGGNGDENPATISTCFNGNYVILGSTSSKGNTSKSDWLFEIDKSNGNMIWDFTYGNLIYGTFGYTVPLGFYQNNNGQYYITGLVSDSYYARSSAYIVKTDETANLLGEYTYVNADGINYSRGNSIIVNSNSEIYIFGTRISELSDNSNALFLTKLKEF
jgi:hypothetical protein